MTGRFDDKERRIAAQITHSYPHWLVTWGTYSRFFWAFPRFDVPPGTIIAAPDTAELLTLMRYAELAAAPGRQ